jgi:hypothetical protein
MDVGLVLSPLTQLNTPYPSISYLAEHLRTHGIECTQRDLGIELILSLFSPSCLEEVFAELDSRDELPEPAWRVLSLRHQHLQVISPVIAFLQGADTSLATRILETPFLPLGPRLERADLEAFGPMGAQDAARHLATLYLDDLADLFTSCVDEGFGLARYQAHLSRGTISFDPLWRRLGETSLVDRRLDELADSISADVVGVSVPFPGNLYGALRIGRRLKARGATVLLGGGYINTELRELDEDRIWECVDAITYDDGEGPLLAILEYIDGGTDRRHRTRTAEGLHDASVPRPPVGCAAHYGDLDLGAYLQTIDTLNPAHRLWNDGRWNKITIAHGCYWKRCTFCDVSLDYISHYEDAGVTRLVDHIERLIDETKQTGFHFVDEAAPPRALKALALEILARGLSVTLWGNIRFENAFTPDLCRLLAAAGVVAVTGGLEVANERLLEAIDKGVSVQQVARAAAAFRQAGIMVHAYLMYGFPTQTVQETVDSMELVRQLFAADLLNSAFWHRFVLTRHAPIAQDPQRFGVTLRPQPNDVFTGNDLEHDDPTGADHDAFDEPLTLALEDWLKGQNLERPVHEWFDHGTPPTTENHRRIVAALDESFADSGTRLVWLGGEPVHTEAGLMLHTPDCELLVEGDPKLAGWLSQLLTSARPGGEPILLEQAQRTCPQNWQAFSDQWREIRELGLVLV